MKKPSVLVSIVTFNSEPHLRACLRSVWEQEVPVQIKVYDNASQDRSCDVALEHGVQLYRSIVNRGFSHGHNFHLREGNFDYALILNPDVILSKGYLKILLKSMGSVAGTGMAGGKLFRMDEHGQRLNDSGYPILDTTGIYFTPNQRHLDRGSQEVDLGQYDRRQLVFGISGAAMLCSREMLEDIQFENEYLDEDFFIYREDADLAWRAQLRGWKALYDPAAEGLHLRHVLPSVRRQLSSDINYHSLKNRYLLRMKNLDSEIRRKCFLHMWIRDLGIFLYVLVREPSSLVAYWRVLSLRERFHRKRSWVRASRRVPPGFIAEWFSFNPTARDL